MIEIFRTLKDFWEQYPEDRLWTVIEFLVLLVAWVLATLFVWMKHD
jgi:hypothetical protein